MSTSHRGAFLSRVTEAVRAGSRYRETQRSEIPPSVGYLGAGEDPIARFMEELRTVGAHPQRTGTREEAGALVRTLVERFTVQRAIVNATRILRELEILETLRGAGVEVATPEELAVCDEATRRDRCFAADLGVAAADWAIAETGSLVYASGPQQTRSATLLPPVHLAVVDCTRILADLIELPAKLQERSVDGVLPRNVALVTGPSKTGDIELRLTTGVHGPGEVHVVIWERTAMTNVEVRMTKE
ncbi:MAG: lactate utilization protein [Planctomycetes bacterium]|nr:lactate utilization protein [Planctomycetota bacterium]